MTYAKINALYVSQKDGNIFNTGFNPQNDIAGNGPLISIQKAIESVAGMRMAGYLQPIKIYLMDDIYYFNTPLSLSAYSDIEQIQTLANDITFTPYKKQTVLFSGGKKLTGWQEGEFNGCKCWVLQLDEVKKGNWDFKDLYVNGENALRTRYPKEGFLYPESVENESETNAFLPSNWITAEKGDIKTEFGNLKDTTIHFNHYWVDEHIGVREYDSETRKITFDVPTRMTITAERDKYASMPYYLENIGSAFHREGEWFLDRNEGLLYYKPRKGENLQNTEIYAPVIDHIIDVDGMTGVHFENIVFSYTQSSYRPKIIKTHEDGSKEEIFVGADAQAAVGLHGAVNFKESKHCTMRGCFLSCCGSYGVKIHEGCDHIEIVRCTISDLAGGGISVVGSNALDESSKHTHDIRIADCRLYRLGLKYFSAVGILVTHGYNCVIEHNEIFDLNYSGISVGWTWGYADSPVRNNQILKNHIYNIGKGILSDMGGIYLLGKQPGTRIEGNLIHDVQSRNYGAWGIYLDEGSSYITVENNICYNVENGFHQHYGMMNVVCNNIFAYANSAAIKLTRGQPFVGVSCSSNIFLCKAGTPPYERVPDYSIAPSAYFSSDFNCIWSEGTKISFGGAEQVQGLEREIAQSELGWDKHSVFADPLFIDAENKNFHLRKNSPAYEIGFKDIIMEDVGVKI